MEEQYLTRGFLSSVSPVLHFGLGADTIIPEIQVIWTDGKEQVIKETRANQIITLKYSEARQKHDFSKPVNPRFTDITQSLKLNYRHVESKFIDFSREKLLPHKMSDLGPGIAVGDVNNDGLDDFYIGGAKGYSGKLFIQTNNGFETSNSQPWTEDIDCEDMGALFFDADKDGDVDLYVVSGSNEYEEGSPFLQDRLYLNDGAGNFTKTRNVLPPLSFSGSCVVAGDFDGDGDLDLFIGGRQKPGKYPLPVSSHLLRNDSDANHVRFTDVTSSWAPQLINIGMVTDATFTDIDGDRKPDLVIVGEWMPVKILRNNGKNFEDITERSGLSQETGWWNCITASDIDKDGDMDLIAGNMGLNSKFKASYKYPFEIYAMDFDNNGTLDIVTGYYNNNILYPVYGLRRSSDQLPFIKQKFKSNDAFARATLEDVYGAENLKKALNYNVRNFASCYLENNGSGTFKIKPLDNHAQISTVKGIIAGDIDNDGNPDLVIAGNNYETEIETTRNDASIGLFLKGDGAGNFVPVPAFESGLLADGDVRMIKMIRIGKPKSMGIIVAKNNGPLQVIKIN
jgi:hypothetical protein